MCDVSPLFADTPDLMRSVRVLSCPCGTATPAGADLRAGAIVLRPAADGKVQKLLWLLGLRAAIRRATARLRREGLTDCSVVAVWPSLERAAVVYDVGTAAAAYAETRTLPGQPSALGPALRALSGVHPAIDAVVITGLRPEPRRHSHGSAA